MSNYSNIFKRRETRRLWRLKNIEKVRAYNNQWLNENPEKREMYNERNRLRRKMKNV